MARSGHRTRPLSDDLRCTLWHMHYKVGLSVEQIAATSGVHKRTIYRIFEAFERTGDVMRRPQVRGSLGKLQADDLLFLESCIQDSSDAYLDELKLRLEEYANVKVSLSTVWRTLRKLGFTLKKVSKSALERNEMKRMEYIYHIGMTYQADQLVFVDESSFDRRTTYRGRAWALKGQKAERKVFYVRGKRYSILPAMSLDGMLFCDIVEGSYDTERFIAFIEQLLDCMQPLVRAGTDFGLIGLRMPGNLLAQLPQSLIPEQAFPELYSQVLDSYVLRLGVVVEVHYSRFSGTVPRSCNPCNIELIYTWSSYCLGLRTSKTITKQKKSQRWLSWLAR